MRDLRRQIQLHQYVEWHDVHKVKRILKVKPKLVEQHLSFKDVTGFQFTEITMYQYATLLDATEMAQTIALFMSEKQIAEQLQELNNRQDIHHKRGLTCIECYLKKLEYFVKHFTYMTGYCADIAKQRENYWCNKVGKAQLNLPAWFIYIMLDENLDADHIAQYNNIKFTVDVKKLHKWFQEKGKLGVNFAWMRGKNTVAKPLSNGCDWNMDECGGDWILHPKIHTDIKMLRGFLSAFKKTIEVIDARPSLAH